MSSEASTKQSSRVSFVLAGAFIGGAAATLALRFRTGGAMFQRGVDQEKAVKQAMESMNLALNGLRQDVQQSVTGAESRLGAKLQTQERAIVHGLTHHYKELNTRLDTVNAARNELSGMSRKMDDLQTIFISPKRRGAFGELQLEGIISDVMHPGSFQFQATLSNGKRPDCLLKLPKPIGNLAIDSKFPMDSFLELSKVPLASLDAKTESPDLLAARKKLSDNLRKHVKDIADKYIIPGETADCALLFLPSEAIFCELVEHHASMACWQVVEKIGLECSRVWIACPTTLMAVLTTMRGVVRGMAVNERADAIVSEVGAILQDIDRLVTRAEKVEKNVDSARENLRQMRISIDKVQRKKEKLDSLNEDGGKTMVLGASTDMPPRVRVNGEVDTDDDRESEKQHSVSA